MTCQEYLPPFDGFCIQSALGEAISTPSFSTVRIRNDPLNPRYRVGDCIRIDFTTEPLSREWGAVDHWVNGRAHRSFGVIHRRDRRGVVVATYLWPQVITSLQFIAAQRIIRIGWARPWDAENVLMGYLNLQAAQAKQKAA